MQMTTEGLRRLRHAVCHDDPDPGCESCLVGVLAEAVRMLLEVDKGEYRENKSAMRYNQLTMYLDFLKGVGRE